MEFELEPIPLSDVQNYLEHVKEEHKKLAMQHQLLAAKLDNQARYIEIVMKSLAAHSGEVKQPAWSEDFKNQEGENRKENKLITPEIIAIALLADKFLKNLGLSIGEMDEQMKTMFLKTVSAHKNLMEEIGEIQLKNIK